MTSEQEPTEDFDPHETADDFATEAEGASGESRSPGPIREWIGPYRILKKIAHGGMGAVYLAEQEKPIKRQVAVKVIRAERGESEQIVARFEAERQALALMDHPNIARVLHGGAAQDGSPYFAMELVNGIPFTSYCDEKKLSIRERLKLFIPVCRAVQHAHQKGIIHRDLKPSNVLVTEVDGVPVPKVIDFGLAKATDQKARLTDKTMATEMGNILGTVQYMSPEQAELDQLDIDTRTDIYSLGVMLYELLTGSTPIDQETMDRHQLRKLLDLICEREPPKPSMRLSDTGPAIQGVSDQRKILPSKLQQILRGELDWIVMKALDKERSRRYATANDFAADIDRFLNNDAVVARPPSVSYRLQKALRKYRVAVAITAAFVITNLTLLGLVTRWYLVADYEKNRNEQLVEQEKLLVVSETNAKLKAEKEADDQLAATEFLFNIFGAGDPLFSQVISPYGVELSGNTQIKDVVAAAIRNEIEDEKTAFEDKPILRSKILTGLGDMAISNSQLELAGQAFSKSLEQLERETVRSDEEVQTQHAKLLVSRALLDLTYGDMAGVEEKILLAEPILAKAVEPGDVLSNLRRSYEDCALILGLAYLELDRLEEARRQFEILSKVQSKGPASDLRRLSGRFFDLSVQREILERSDKSTAEISQKFSPLIDNLRHERTKFNSNISRALGSAIIAQVAHRAGRTDSAVQALESVSLAFSESLGEDHILNALGDFFMTISLEQMDRNEEALQYGNKFLRIIDTVLKDRKHPILCFYFKKLADIHLALWREGGKKDPSLQQKAMESIEESIRIGEQAFGSSSWRLANAYYGRGKIHAYSGKFDLALSDFEFAYNMYCKELGEQNKFPSYCLREMAKVNRLTGELEVAETQLRKRVSTLEYEDANLERLGKAQYDLADLLWERCKGREQISQDKIDEIRSLLGEATSKTSSWFQSSETSRRSQRLLSEVNKQIKN